jgi:predicted ATPase
MSLDIIKRMFISDTQRNIFQQFIEYIRFPYYKNFSEDMKINFTFPITFLVGQNGTGKSSLLQALYGAPDGQKVSDYWFNTKLDPIVDTNADGKRHCFVYSFLTPITKTSAEVLRSRILNGEDPDFWESARPQARLGMQLFNQNWQRQGESSKTRWNLIKKKVHYLDFRYEISAFDKYFYFGEEPNSSKLKTKQDFLRKMSPYIKRAHIVNLPTKFYNRKCAAPIVLTEEELLITNDILGKRYVRGEILKHNMYDVKVSGFSIILKTDFSEYSEAFAGSGETAIVKIVHEVFNASDYSLILLDEPETSLHPGAQNKLINFLLEQIKLKKLQMVVSTHSPHIIEKMPKEAIKVFYIDESTGRTSVVENIPSEEAFFYIGDYRNSKKNIIVEDNLAKMIVEAVLKQMGDAVNNLFEVKFHPGGESVIKNTYIPVYSKDEVSKTFVLFDGDQRRDHVDIEQILEVDKTVSHLNSLIRKQTGEEINFKHDSGRPEQQIPQMLSYLTYYKTKVDYLPCNIPEEVIWDEYVLSASGILKEEKATILANTNYKTKYALFAAALFGESDAEAIKKAHQYFIKRWLQTTPSTYLEIVAIINRIKEI